MEKKLLLFLVSFFLSIGMAMAQTQISGIVTAQEDGQPVVGASILVVGTKTGTVTDIDGKFSLSVPAGAKIEVSYIGMLSKTLTAARNMKIKLETDNKNLDEVVVVAFGTAKRHSITGSVAVVDSKKMADRINTSATSALEGSAPGVQVNSSYGEPGSAPQIHIRGVGTLTNGADQPLYVVDGTVFEGDINELNPNDIESMSVLKDASSAALYGNRAANGVILITTRKAKYSAKPSISVKLNQGFYERGIKEYDRLGPDQWMEASWIAMRNFARTDVDGITTDALAAEYATAHLIKDFVRRNIYKQDDDKLFDANGKLIGTRLPGYDDLDWEKAVERQGHRQEYNVSAAVANDKFNVYSSVGYLNEQGYTINSGFERFTGRINSTFDPTKWLQLGMNITGSYATTSFNEDARGAMMANPFDVARFMAPVYPLYVHNEDGSYPLDANNNPIRNYDTKSEYLSNRNIAFEMRNDNNKSRKLTLDGLLFAKFNLPYGFALTGKANLNRSTVNRLKYENPLIGDGAQNNGRLTETSFQYRTITAQELLTWEHKFDLHNVDVLVGHENFDWSRSHHFIMKNNTSVEGIKVMNNYTKMSVVDGFTVNYKTESYLGRVRYNYDEKYYVDLSFRRDGSSKFEKSKRWGNFYSFGLNWNAKKENFLKNVKWLDALRVRASYGEVGNDAAVGLYGYQALYLNEKNGGNPALVRQKLAAPDIQWENTQTIDFGIEGTILDRINFNLGYFDKRSKDLLFEVRLPLSAGGFYGSGGINFTQYKNIGTISNRGFEIMINGDVIRSKDWTWNLSLDATTLSNKVLKLPDHQDILHGLQNYSEGHSAYEWYTYHFAGVDQTTGQSLYDLDEKQEKAAQEAGQLVEINGKKYTTVTAKAERKWAGTALPSVYGSFSSNLRWKDLSLNVLFAYSLGGKCYDGTYASLMSTGSASSAAALHSDILKSWNGAPSGMTNESANRLDPNGIPQIHFIKSRDNNAQSDRWLTSSSYLTLKNITLSYRLPKSLVQHWGFSNVSVKMGAENLFILTSRQGLNPQYSFNGDYNNTYVTARVFNFGLALDF